MNKYIFIFVIVTLSSSLLSAPDRTVPILMYHKIDSVQHDDTTYWVRTKDFEEQLKSLKALGYTSISLYDFYQYKFNGVSLPDKPIILTFDDGYQNIYMQAYPIMKQYNFTGTLFIITNYVADSSSRRHVNTEISTESGLYPCSLMVWPEVKEMFANGMSIQSHSKTHPESISNDTILEEEVRGSKAVIESTLSTIVNFYCYPYCLFDSQYKEIVKDAGYLGAVEGGVSAEHTATADMYALKRTFIAGQCTINQFLNLIPGAGIFKIQGSHPNPFRNITEINYQVPKKSKVSLKIYDITGRLVKSLVDDTRDIGCYTVKWDGKDINSKRLTTGIYFVTLKSPDSYYRETKKLILIK